MVLCVLLVVVCSDEKPITGSTGAIGLKFQAWALDQNHDGFFSKQNSFLRCTPHYDAREERRR